MPDDGLSRSGPPPLPPARPAALRPEARHRTSRLLVGLGGLLIVASLVTTAAVLWQFRAATIADAEANLRRFAMVLAEQTVAAVQAIDVAVASLVDQPRATAEDRLTLHQQMQLVLAGIAPLQNLFVIDAEGRSVVSTRSHPPPRVSVADRAYFRTHEAGLGGPLFSPTFRNRVDGRWSIVMSQRLSRPDGSFDGIFGADIDPGHLARFYAAMDFGYGGAVLLLHRDGSLLTRYPWVDAAVGQRLPGADEFAARVEAASSGTFRADSPFDGATRLHGYAAVDLYPLVMVTAADLREVLAPWRESAIMAGLSVIAADGVIAALIAILVLQIRRREQSESRFRDFASVASDWYWETGADLRLAYVSPAGQHRAADAAQDAVGRRFEDLILRLPGDETWPRLDAELRARMPLRDVVCQVRARSGRVRHMKLSGQPRFDATGAFLGYRGVARDITAEVEARSASAQANMRFLHAIESSSDGISFWDAEDRFVLCNDRFRHGVRRASRRLVPGVTFEQFFWDGIRHGDVAAAPGKMAEVLARRMAFHRAATGEPFEMQYGEEWRLVRDQRTPDGGTLVLWTDITALKTKDEEIRAAQHDAARVRQQFYVAIEHSDDGFALWDADDRFVLCNKRYRERAGAAAALLVPGTTFETFVREGTRLTEMTSPQLDQEGLIRRRLDLHRRARGEPLELVRDGCRRVVRDQRTPDGGCLVISTELRTGDEALRWLAEEAERASAGAASASRR